MKRILYLAMKPAGCKRILLAVSVLLLSVYFLKVGQGYLTDSERKQSVEPGCPTARPMTEIRTKPTDPRTAEKTTLGPSTAVASPQSSLQHIYALRRQRAEDECFLSPDGRVDRMVEHKDIQAAYCITPKVGCTYWLSIFRWLHNDTYGINYVSPFKMPRYQVHYRPQHMKFYRFDSTKPLSFLADRLRFMYVREPYTRLWSAFVDKFLLPDLWDIDGRNIVGRRTGVNKTTARCFSDITFEEFLDYITSIPAQKLNDHYRPYQYVCSPCALRPHVIGKMETFTQDTKYILERLNMSWVGDQLFASDQHAKHEISMLIDDVFHEYRYPFYQNCTNSTDLAIRLWKAFQINGYLPNSVEFPWATSRQVKQGDLKKLALKTFAERQPGSKHYWAAQKEQSLIDAYSKVPDATMEKLRKMYETDFRMFEYDPYPNILYRKRPLATGPNFLNSPTRLPLT